MRKILVADLFCGAGGSSTGARQAIEADLGRRMDLVCVNHWDRAIETHARMHPEARHYCQDVGSARPIECVPEGRLDLLMASPTCTYHSRARGGRPTSDQQRMDPWHVVTWLTELRVGGLLIENVPEFVDWGPVDSRTGRPLKSKKGQYFREWIATLERLGYRVEWKILNCADYGDATTRRRFFLLGRKKGRIRWPEPTHTKEPRHDLLAPLQRWRPARECIDWDLKGRSIFGRKHPLAPRTIQRIYTGAVRFAWPEPFLVVLRQHMTSRSIDLPLPTIAANGGHIGIAQPVLIRSDAHGAGKLRARSPEEPVQTIVSSGGIGMAEPFMVGQHHDRPLRSVEDPAAAITTVARIGLAEPFIFANRTNNVGKPLDAPLPTNTTTTGGGLGIVEPFVLQAAHGDKPTERAPSNRRVKSLDDPLGTIHAQGGSYGVVEPFIVGAGGAEYAGKPKPVGEPLTTVLCDDRRAVVEPFVVGAGGRAGQSPPRDVSQPLGTITGKGDRALVEPFVLSQASGGAPRAASEPLPTIVTGGQRGSGTALITPYYGNGSGKTCKSVEQPLDTVTTEDRFGLVVPTTHAGGLGRARDVTDPLPTLTTAKRGELAFITASFGERDGQLPRTPDLEQPMPTIPAQGSVRLAEGVEQAAEAEPQYDILFRMLHWRELARAMSFSDADQDYEFAGNKTEITKQIGNAVPVRTARALVRAALWDMAA